jgi:hypothetical protein
MSRVEQSIAVRCPLATGHTHLDNWFRAHASPDGERATLALVVTAAIVGLDKPMRASQRGRDATKTAGIRIRRCELSRTMGTRNARTVPGVHG